MTLYRLSFETVSAIAHPQCYNPRTERASWPAEAVPEEWWHKVHRDTEDPWDQLAGLRQIRFEGELIRNIEVEELTPVQSVRVLVHDP